MTAVFNILGATLALVGFLFAARWVLTKKTSPAARARRGWAAVFLFGASATVYVLGGNFS